MEKAACLGWLQGKQCQRYGKGYLDSDDYSVNKRCTETYPSEKSRLVGSNFCSYKEEVL